MSTLLNGIFLLVTCSLFLTIIFQKAIFCDRLLLYSFCVRTAVFPSDRCYDSWWLYFFLLKYHEILENWFYWVYCTIAIFFVWYQPLIWIGMIGIFHLSISTIACKLKSSNIWLEIKKLIKNKSSNGVFQQHW